MYREFGFRVRLEKKGDLNFCFRKNLDFNGGSRE